MSAVISALFVLMSREHRMGGVYPNIYGTDCSLSCWKDKRAKKRPWKLGFSTGGDETQSRRASRLF